MFRLLPCLLALTMLAQPLRSADAAPAPLPEKVQHGDGPATYPAECARRIDAGKALLDSGDLKGAGREFDLAEKADAAEPMSYFYRAVIAYRQGDYPVALKMADEALTNASDRVNYANAPGEADLKKVQLCSELYDTIKAKFEANPAAGNAVALLRAADEAYASGLLAKAAAAYADAFRADPTKGEVGLKAATLFADRLKNPLEAARLWQKVLAAGEPHATTARTELQTHRDVLDGVLRAGLARRDQWRRQSDTVEPSRLAEAFPDSAELQFELAYLFARKGSVGPMIQHLQAASRLGLSTDDFLARKELVDQLQQGGGLETATGKAFASFVRDAYGEETLTTIRTELKRRADETTRLAREKAEQERDAAREKIRKERQAQLAKELKEHNAWRHTERMKAVAEIGALLGSRNGIEVPVAKVTPSKYDGKSRFSHARSNYFSHENGQYALRSDDTSTIYYTNGRVNTSSTTETSWFNSAAAFTDLTSRPSSWLDVTTESGFQPAAAYRQLCQLLTVNFRSGVIFRRVIWRNYDGEVTNNLDMPNLGSIMVHAMVTDQDLARLRQLFGRLAQLDAAGDNVEKLRQLRQ